MSVKHSNLLEWFLYAYNDLIVSSTYVEIDVCCKIPDYLPWILRFRINYFYEQCFMESTNKNSLKKKWIVAHFRVGHIVHQSFKNKFNIWCTLNPSLLLLPLLYLNLGRMDACIALTRFRTNSPLQTVKQSKPYRYLERYSSI